MRNNVDLYTVLVLKQGQLEVQYTNSFDPNFHDAVLIHRSVVEDLNATTKKLGQAKIEHMEKKAEYTRGIHVLEWENKTLDMLVSQSVSQSY